jgi:hypothetical protein
MMEGIAEGDDLDKPYERYLDNGGRVPTDNDLIVWVRRKKRISISSKRRVCRALQRDDVRFDLQGSARS